MEARITAAGVVFSVILGASLFVAGVSNISPENSYLLTYCICPGSVFPLAIYVTNRLGTRRRLSQEFEKTKKRIEQFAKRGARSRIREIFAGIAEDPNYSPDEIN